MSYYTHILLTEGICLQSLWLGKLKIVQEAEKVMLLVENTVSESYIRASRKNKELMLHSSDIRGHRLKYREREEKLCRYVSEKQQFGYAVSTKVCQL
jgi:hypothetical protein